MKFLFWNINKNSAGSVLSQIVSEHEVDLVVLAECRDEGEILASLNSGADDRFHLTDSGTTRVVIYTRFSRSFIQPEHHDDYLTIRRICLTGRPEILLAAAHLPSRLHRKSDDEQVKIARGASESIRKCEARTGHSRTVLVGDLNMNPFEKGLSSADTLHAVMTRDIAVQKSRIVLGTEYHFFYNPMWGCFGDTTKGPPGTYYRRKSDLLEYFWYVFDQVLIRPALLDYFDNEALQILTRCGETSLLHPSGAPDATRASDSPSVLFTLKI